MADEVLLSVIIPIYNGEKTLRRCIESLLQQKGVNLEIICVDDGSTDGSLFFCRSISEKDNRVKVLTKKNGGVASARNVGMKEASGKYITFIDQDDWIEKGAYSILINTAIKNRADMVVCNYSKDYTNKIETINNKKEIPLTIKSKDDLIKYAFFREEYRGFAAFVWNKIYKKDFLDKNGIVFDDTLSRGDDVLFFCHVALKEPNTVYLDRCLYHYVQRMDSVTHTLTKNNMERLSEILVGYKRAISSLEKADVSKESLAYMKCFYVYHASILYELAVQMELKNEKEQFRNAMKEYLQEYKNQNRKDLGRIERIDRLVGE